MLREQAVSMIVGRDTKNLTEEGVIAPMLYMAVGGAVLGFAYKAVNTMDSMVGYKNERYVYFGTAARLDDAVNFIPARISAWLMAGAFNVQLLSVIIKISIVIYLS